MPVMHPAFVAVSRSNIPLNRNTTGVGNTRLETFSRWWHRDPPTIKCSRIAINYPARWTADTRRRCCCRTEHGLTVIWTTLTHGQTSIVVFASTLALCWRNCFIAIASVQNICNKNIFFKHIHQKRLTSLHLEYVCQNKNWMYSCITVNNFKTHALTQAKRILKLIYSTAKDCFVARNQWSCYKWLPWLGLILWVYYWFLRPIRIVCFLFNKGWQCEVVMTRYIEISIIRFRYRYVVSYRIVEKDIDFFDMSRYFDISRYFRHHSWR